MKFRIINFLIFLGILVFTVSCSQNIQKPSKVSIKNTNEPSPSASTTAQVIPSQQEDTSDIAVQESQLQKSIHPPVETEQPIINPNLILKNKDNPVAVEYKDDRVKSAMQLLDPDSINNMISSLLALVPKKDLVDHLIIQSVTSGNILSSNTDDLVLVVTYCFYNDIPGLEENATLILTKDGERYTVAYAQRAFGDISISLCDINNDGKKEVFEYVTDDYKGSFQRLTVLEHNGGGKINQIFNVQCSNTLHGSYESKFNYELEYNKSNPSLIDVILNLQSQKKALEELPRNHDNITPVKPLKDQIIFMFDGTKYVPNKDISGYIYFEF